MGQKNSAQQNPGLPVQSSLPKTLREKPKTDRTPKSRKMKGDSLQKTFSEKTGQHFPLIPREKGPNNARSRGVLRCVLKSSSRNSNIADIVSGDFGAFPEQNSEFGIPSQSGLCIRHEASIQALQHGRWPRRPKKKTWGGEKPKVRVKKGL